MNSAIKTASTDSQDWRKIIINGVTKLVSHQTWRKFEGEKVVNEDEVRAELSKIKEEYFDEKKTDLMQPFEWEGADGDKKYWVFGYRAGAGRRKVSIICHLDTVPPGNDNWNPFEAREETRIYKGAPTPFLIGRGAIDDKGPAVVAFEAFTRALAGLSADSDALKRVTLEVLFDTSEETDMSTPHYFAKHPEKKPKLGIVFDAYWSVRAEKGIERPLFTVSADAVPAPASETALVIVTLTTPPQSSANMIPVTAEAHIQGPDEALRSFAKKVKDWYLACPFDDPDYHPADIQVTHSNGEVVITALVAGAQHGSAPHQNRANGANPVVSLTNFLAFLVDCGILANNYNGEMSRFIRWVFGTRVFGENHPDLLSRFDSVFQEGNGTTYALTQLIPNEEKRTIQLNVDVRYAIGHHSQGWDGSEGQIKGESLFKTVFDKLVQRYSEANGAEVTVTLREVKKEGFGPDIRSLRNANLFRVNMAYRSVMGENCTMHATGGATDAHSFPELVTAGALFTIDMGPPINYHGLDEGALLTDLENSGKILLYLLQQELAAPVEQWTIAMKGFMRMRVSAERL